MRINDTDNLEQMGEYWDGHDLTEVDAGGPDAEFEIACAVPIEEELYSSLEEQARIRGVRVETLVNLWLQQKLTENQSSATAR